MRDRSIKVSRIIKQNVVLFIIFFYKSLFEKGLMCCMIKGGI